MACFASLWEMVTYFYNKVIRFPKPEASGHIVAMILIDGDGDGGGGGDDDDGGDGDGDGEPETFGHIGEALDRITDRLARLHAALYACVLQAFLQGSVGHGP